MSDISSPYHLMALSWTHSFKSVSFSEEPRAARSATEVASPVVSKGEGDLMAGLYLSNAARLPLAAFVTGERCCSMFNLVSTRTHSPHICFTACLPQPVLVEGVIPPQGQDFAFPFVLS